MAVRKAKKRRKKKRYITGVHASPKCLTPIKYRSGWELEVCKFLDYDKSVISYAYESIIIPYISNVRTGKIRSYFPDFLISYIDGTRKLIEVKRKDKLNDPIVMKKAEAAKIWAKKQNPSVLYEMWTNTVIEAFRKINEAANPVKTPKPPRRRRKASKKA